MGKHKILFVTTNDFGFGGSEDIWVATARFLIAQGHSVAASVRAWEPRPRLLQDLVTTGCRMLWHSSPPISGDFSDMVEFEPDFVVVSQGYHLEGIDWLAEIVRRRLPFLIINNGVHESGWPSISEADIEHITRLHSAAREYCFVSEGNRRLHERFFGYPVQEYSIVHNPFKVNYVTDLPWPASPPLRLATVGRLECYHKGYDLLIEALADPLWRDRAVEIHMYGSGPHRELLERLAIRSGSKQIVFHGFTEDIEGIWRANHALLQPSRLEGMPMSVIEAMLCARPVLATDVGGHAEMITDGANGFLAEAATVTHVRRSLESLWLNRHRLREMGEAARITAYKRIPPNPAAAFATRILGHVSQALADQRGLAVDRSQMRAVPPPAGLPSDQFAHLYWAADSQFNEQARLAGFYCAGIPVTLVFASLSDRIRFDPSIGPGQFQILRTRLSDMASGNVLLLAEGVENTEAWTVSGTAYALEGVPDALVVESTGDDPQLCLKEIPQTASSLVRLEITLLALCPSPRSFLSPTTPR
jgi:glycosyltransferase involved in cell wall biosynthesis